MNRTRVAIIGSGDLGTDLMEKILRESASMDVGAMAGVDPTPVGLAHAVRRGVPITTDGVDGLIALKHFDEIDLIFDTTSTAEHLRHDARLRPLGKTLIDLTPAAVGPFVVPAVNGGDHLGANNVNVVTSGGQAAIPIVAAVSRIATVPYAEMVTSIASRAAGPDTRAQIDEYTEMSSDAIVAVAGAQRGKAIIILNPVEPPMMMRTTVFCLVAAPDRSARQRIADSVVRMAEDVRAYVPGFRLTQPVLITDIPPDQPVHTLLAEGGAVMPTHQVAVFVEVMGTAHDRPSYAGDADIMTSAAVRIAEHILQSRQSRTVVAR